MDALIEDLSHSDQALKGDLRLGVIPTVEPAAGLLSVALKREHPGITLTLFSKTSDEIIRGIEDRSLDGGLSYVPDRRIRQYCSDRSTPSVMCCSQKLI
ncbi:MAG: hypothetical protein FJY62_03305 [Betaproteobacteria bacterium]|nr:hypothetical protein [Betaproteobacteria bacterium]